MRRDKTPMSSEPVFPSKRAEARARRRARREARIAQGESYFELLASGYSCRQIAEAAKVSVLTVKRAIDRAIAERRLDAADRYAHLQVTRLNKALRLADASIERGELRAIEPYMRLIAALDRYHGLGPAGARSRKAAIAHRAAPAAPPLALPAPPPALTSVAPPDGSGSPAAETVSDEVVLESS
jgi:hypothetical protein